MRRRRANLLRIYAAPAVLGGATAVGLTAGLLGDGSWDVLSAVALAMPLVPVCMSAAPALRRVHRP